jgi:hypothetical protein
MALMLVATMVVPAMAAEEEVGTTASVSVNEFVNITLGGSINFGSLTPPQSDVGATGQTDGNPAITITVEPETNVDIDISIKGAINTGNLALSNWKYSTTFGGAKTGLTGSYIEVYDTAGSSSDFYHWIDVPAGTDSGSHTVDVSYKAETHS